ncbi:hypothetical protein NPIL_371811 [Nephila pilipes]|uniref:DUF5641 domain-containing protein n=1 Tax=Nephila pilipes TaxID=299642 RepID=A0A8X6N8W6_NEPPI|nr:hypothetical protein NPIL_371811 [Nephila pilipes]
MAQNRSCFKRRRDSEGKMKNCCFSFDIYQGEMDIKTVGVPDIDNLDKLNLTKRWRYHWRLREQFRKRFRDEYLGLLVQRPLKRKFVRPIEINDIDLVGQDNLKRSNWLINLSCYRYVSRKRQPGTCSESGNESCRIDPTNQKTVSS